MELNHSGELRRFANGHPIVEGERFYLVISNAIDNDYFCSVFKRTWDSLPSECRERISASANSDSSGLLVEVISFADEERSEGCSDFVLMLQFDTTLVDLYVEDSLARIIAHKLAHIWDDLTNRDPNDPDREPKSDLDRRVSRIAESWGYPELDEDEEVESTEADTERLGRNVKIYKQRASGSTL